MSDHVAVGEFADNGVKLFGFDGFNQLVGNFINAHFRFKVIGCHLGAGNEDSFLAFELFFFAAVKKERDMSVFFGFGNTQLGQPVFGHHFAEYVGQSLRRKHRVHKTVVVDRIFRHADML